MTECLILTLLFIIRLYILMMTTATMLKMREIHIQLDPHFKAPPPDPETLSKFQFVLVRHAVTEFNMEFARIAGEHGFDGEDYR